MAQPATFPLLASYQQPSKHAVALPIAPLSVIDGHYTEPPLGDTDAKALGILTINHDGYTKEHKEPGQHTEQVAGITSNLRAAGITINSTITKEETITPEEQARIHQLLEKHQDIFSGIGLLKDDHVNFHIDPTVPRVAAAYRPVPLAYCTKLSEHLATLQQQNKIEDVNPDEHSPWISNVVITEEKDKQQIRMNIDMCEANKALKRTAHHVEMIQEIQHLLKGATRHSEMDLSHGFHQITLHPDSRYISTFRTHEGLGRFKILFFGASPASELFHNKIKEALRSLPGCISIHDNILIYGKTPEEHETNLSACLARIKAKGSPSITASAHLAQHLSHGLATSSAPLVCQLTPAKSKPLPPLATHIQRTKSKASCKPASTTPNSCLTPTKHMHR